MIIVRQEMLGRNARKKSMSMFESMMGLRLGQSNFDQICLES